MKRELKDNARLASRMNRSDRKADPDEKGTESYVAVIQGLKDSAHRKADPDEKGTERRGFL